MDLHLSIGKSKVLQKILGARAKQRAHLAPNDYLKSPVGEEGTLSDTISRDRKYMGR
jgi:hypothetical protein